jgi:ABC-2 type transport system permease protein
MPRVRNPSVGRPSTGKPGVGTGIAELVAHRDLIRELVVRALKVRYRRSAIGFLWTMLHPLIMMLVLSLVFSQVFRADVPNYALYALTGIVFWQFFSQTVTSCLHSLKGNARLLTKLPVPKAVFPVATVLSGLLNLAFALVPLFGIAVVTGHAPTAAIVFLPVGVGLVGLMALGAGLLLAPLSVIFSDTVEVVGILLTLLMYLTPVFYPRAIVPEHLRWAVRVNPLAAALEVFRAPIVDHTLPATADLLIASACAVVLLAAGSWFFAVSSRRLALYL